ncbi:MAG: hypothetical protein A07HR60_00060 [uncultured archaeon A07HR60]|nr:MAG: hypothetical protein A07HR60_00060 [uncultured archaeon A07HR60]
MAWGFGVPVLSEIHTSGPQGIRSDGAGAESPRLSGSTGRLNRLGGSQNKYETIITLLYQEAIRGGRQKCRLHPTAEAMMWAFASLPL